MSFSLLGASSWGSSLLRGLLYVKTLSTCWTGDGGAFGVVTFLEASLVETHLSQMMEGLPVAWQGGSVQVVNSKGLPSSCGGDQNLVGGGGSSYGCWFWLLAADCGG